jgi:hypothetical protein
MGQGVKNGVGSEEKGQGVKNRSGREEKRVRSK